MQIFVSKPEQMMPLGRQRCRREDNIKINMGRGFGIDSSSSV
jgi:hypothetical protein